MTEAMKRAKLEEKLIENFRAEFYANLGYFPDVTTQLTEYVTDAPMTLKDLEDCFEEFLPMKFKKKLYLTSPTRYRELVDLRAIFSHIARSMKYTYSTIGDYLGKRHHSTILHYNELFDEQMYTSDYFRGLHDKILNKVKEKLKNIHESKPSVMVYIDKVLDKP